MQLSKATVIEEMTAEDKFKKTKPNQICHFPGGAVDKNPPANAEDTESCRVTKPVNPKYWACTAEPGSCNCQPAAATTEVQAPRACAPREEPRP